MKDDVFRIVNADPSKTTKLRLGVSDQVADILRVEILSGEPPAGSRLHEAEISDRLGISRGPVRDSLRTLQSEGLITSDWHKGAFVRTLTLKDAIEIYTLRTALERLAIDRAITFRTGVDLEQLEGRIQDIERARDAPDQTDMLMADIAFHQQIYVAAHHELLFQSWASLRSQIAFVLLQRQEPTADYKDLMVQEHRLLYQVIRDQNREKAVEMIQEHVSSAFERLKGKLYPLEPARIGP
jgi:DNA-binding GntR family transcriptional regulator